MIVLILLSEQMTESHGFFKSSKSTKPVKQNKQERKLEEKKRNYYFLCESKVIRIKR